MNKLHSWRPCFSIQMGSVGTVFVFRELWSRQEGERMGELRAAFTGWEGGVCLRAESLQSDRTLRNPMDCRPPGSSVHRILQARNTGVGCHALLQGIFPTAGMRARRERMNDILGNGRLHRNLEAGALITGLCRLMPVRAALSHWVAGWSEAAENEEWKWSLSGV